MVDELVEALGVIERLIAREGISDDVLAEARERMAFIDEGMKALGRCDMEHFKKLQKRAKAAVRTTIIYSNTSLVYAVGCSLA